MSIRNLDKMFKPQAVAVIGASNRAYSVGRVVMHNLLGEEFTGPIMPVNPKYDAVAGVLAFDSIQELPQVPDLAVICTPPQTVPEIISQLGDRGCRSAVVITAAVDEEAMLKAARPHMMRLLGPNCVGLLVPGQHLNASFAPSSLPAGKIAFASQSGALCTAVLDWAAARDIGFSHFISMGNCADVDFGDVIDYLARDPETESILLYIESVKHPRKFLSAARAASRAKPIIAIKSGRNEVGAHAAASHTGALAGGDDVYDAAFARAGILRVDTTEDLFNAVETLAHVRPLEGEKLCIITNGGGAGVMAADLLGMESGEMAELSERTVEALDEVLPSNWSRANPVDIIGDAPAERYVKALEILSRAEELDALLVMHAPVAVTSAEDLARGVVPILREMDKPVLTNWLGEKLARPAREVLSRAGLPVYETPASAVRAFMQLVKYHRRQRLLLETPESIPADFTPDRARALDVIRGVLGEGRDMLDEVEAKSVLAAYDIPVVETRVAKDAEDASLVANELGYPVAVKILSKDISHKSDVGGVVLNLKTPVAVREAAKAISERIRDLRPDADIEGFTVQKMIKRPNAHELLAGAFVDPIFGPVLMFGQGGTAVEVIRDRAVALPPLNMAIAERLISETRIYKLLSGYRDRAAADLEDIKITLVKLSQLIADLAEVAELDINPLLADEEGVIALDARIVVKAAESEPQDRLSICPYPRELEEVAQVDGQALVVRPIRPEDEDRQRAFFEQVEDREVRAYFFSSGDEPGHEELARHTQIDYDREMSFIALPKEGGETWGCVRSRTDPDNIEAEFAILVRADETGRGLGSRLLDKLISYSRERGTEALVGHVPAENANMLKLAAGMGFEETEPDDDNLITIRLALQNS